jgi:hypothetical protein
VYRDGPAPERVAMPGGPVHCGVSVIPCHTGSRSPRTEPHAPALPQGATLSRDARGLRAAGVRARGSPKRTGCPRRAEYRARDPAGGPDRRLGPPGGGHRHPHDPLGAGQGSFRPGGSGLALPGLLSDAPQRAGVLHRSGGDRCPGRNAVHRTRERSRGEPVRPRLLPGGHGHPVVCLRELPGRPGHRARLAHPGAAGSGRAGRSGAPPGGGARPGPPGRYRGRSPDRRGRRAIGHGGGPRRPHPGALARGAPS